ncbi:MAG: hypothetical protein ACYDH4_09595 [Candidatus Cryosericum sp.]
MTQPNHLAGLVSGAMTAGAAIFGAYLMMKVGRPEGSTRSNATYATLRRRIQYGGRKGRRAEVRMYGSRRAMREAPTLGSLLSAPRSGASSPHAMGRGSGGETPGSGSFR